MLTNLAAVLLSFGLLGSLAPEAHGHAATRWPPDPTAQVEVKVDRAKLKKALAKRRAKNFAAFRAYAKKGVYPRNDFRVGPLNVWMDENGNLCAAATIINADGLTDLVKKIAETDNFIRLQNVTEGPLLDWMLTSGFTFEEIELIQAPAVYPDGMRPDWAGEQARLRDLYRRVDDTLVANKKKSLETAVDRLMKSPELAKKLLAST